MQDFLNSISETLPLNKGLKLSVCQSLELKKFCISETLPLNKGLKHSSADAIKKLEILFQRHFH